MSELPPTERRRAEARRRGLVAVSPILVALGGAVGAAAGAALGWPGAGRRLVAFAELCFAARTPPEAALSQLLPTLAALAAPVGLGALLGALAAGLLQTGALFTLGAVGERRPAGAALPRPAVAWAALVALLVAAWRVAVPAAAALARAGSGRAVLAVAADALVALALRIVLVAAAAGALELVWRRVDLARSLRMSRAERRRETREEEGDPRLRAEARRRQRA